MLDVRPASAFNQTHIRDSHSLPIPSTLLRRPSFNVAKIAAMLPSHSAQIFSGWREMSHIILTDVDSSQALEGSVVAGLASKFDCEGYEGQLWFIRGGVAAVTRSVLVTNTSDMDVDEAPGPDKGLMIGRLGTLAFQQGSTGSQRPGDMKFFNLGPQSATSITSGNTAHQASETSSPSALRLQPANPFFDNIRQNLELGQGITDRIPLLLNSLIRARASDFPPWLGDLIAMSEKESAEKLSEEFHNIEVFEQKRLQTIMDFHAQGSGAVDSNPTLPVAAMQLREQAQKAQHARDMDDQDKLGLWESGQAISRSEYFPFSITAGVERGAKNRYKNIWPYDFSRVRLATATEDESDYINASFVQPRGTSRRYIATQGPLDATYRDFWAVVWEQGVRVIVMYVMSPFSV